MNQTQALYLEVIKDHLSELLHWRASGGLVEHGGFSPRLRLLAQLVVHNLPQLTADDPIVVSPASCVHLPNRMPNKHLTRWTLREVEFQVLERAKLVSHLVIWQRWQTPAHVECVFVTQTAAGRAIDDSLPVFITLGENAEKCDLMWSLFMILFTHYIWSCVSDNHKKAGILFFQVLKHTEITLYPKVDG